MLNLTLTIYIGTFIIRRKVGLQLRGWATAQCIDADTGHESWSVRYRWANESRADCITLNVYHWVVPLHKVDCCGAGVGLAVERRVWLDKVRHIGNMDANYKPSWRKGEAKAGLFIARCGETRYTI